MAWQDAFKVWGPAFGAKGPAWDASVGHRGTDLSLGAGQVLPAWEKLTIVNSDYKGSKLGYGVIARCEHGYEFDIGHLRGGTRPANGAVIEPGASLGRIASGPASLNPANVNFPGTSWFGPHAHICMRKGGSAFSTGLLDARPHIVQQLAAPAALNHAYGLTTEAQREMQRALTVLGLYDGLIDGDFYTKSVMATQKLLMREGYLPANYEPDGVPGPRYGGALQKLAQKYGYNGPMDNVPGGATSAALVRWALTVQPGTVTPPPTPPVVVPITPPAWAKTYPGSASVHPSPNRSPRDVAKGGASVKYVILHFTANLADHTGYFTRVNERSVAPNLYARPSGEVREFVRLSERAYTTAVVADHEAITWEIESAGAFTEEQYKALAAFVAWLAQQTQVDGVPVEFTLDRQHVLGHREVPGVTSNTSCPATLDIDRIVRDAQALLPKPTEPPAEPQEPGTDDELVPVKRSILQALLDSLKGILGGK